MKLRTTPALLALAAVGVLVFGVSAAPAKKGKDDKPGKLKTASASTTSTTTGLATATATCPGKSKVVGGGFVFQAPPSGSDVLYPLESRRVSKKAWQASAYRVDTGGNGPAMALSAEAYCRTGLGKLKEKAVAETILGDLGTAAPAATCPVGRAALSGGFSITPPVTPNDVNSLLYENLMVGGLAWQMRAINLTSPPRTETYTSYVYCQAKGEKAPKVVAGTGSVPTTAFSQGAADTAPCSGRRDAFAGGFQFPSFFSGGIAFLTESRHSGKGWHVAASRAGGTGPLPITALGYCS